MQPAKLTYMAPCGIKVEWIVPYDGGIKISGYEVEFKIGEDMWSAKQLSADKFSNSVYVASDLLFKDPFNLEIGDEVVVRIAAINELGMGLMSG